ncbi:hypothetical protein A5482_012390 [Cyanobacterium sp. IPPAS B-1200]|uniref:hypothetical protein n=1 Tax=Cyanobacterium sp. IPPAS B-1200 TaxID=1562720 RepID=UPI00114CB1CD|nr:hypothetical protein [Cyanobacterium sp. IPPAS B-1200]
MEKWQILVGFLGVVVPFFTWWLSQQQANLLRKQKEIQRLKDLIDKLETDLIYTKNQIDAIYKQLAHRSEFAKLKYQVLVDQIADLNNYLNNHTSFVPRKNRVSRDFETMSSYDEKEDPPTGIF